MKEMRPGGLISGLTSHQPLKDEALEWKQRDERDHQKEKERSRQVQARTAEEPIFLPHLQEPTPMTPVQPQRITDQTRMKPVSELIQQSTRPEPPPQVMFQQGGRGGQQRGRVWAGRAHGRPLTFAQQQTLTTQFTCMASQGFGAPSRPAYHSLASALPKGQAWHAPDYKRQDDLRTARKKPTGVKTPPQLKKPPVEERPALAREIAALQKLTDEGTGR